MFAINAYAEIVNNNEFWYNHLFKSLDSEKHGLRGFLNIGQKRSDGGYKRFLKVNEPYDKHKNKIDASKGSYFDEVRLDHKFYLLEFDPKSPLDIEKSTYMGVNTDKLDKYDAYNTIKWGILHKIEKGEFLPKYWCEKNNGWIEEGKSRFRFLEESMAYLIRWKEDRKSVFTDKTNEELLKELVKIHNNTKKDFGYE